MAKKYYKEVDGQTVFFTGNVLYTDECTTVGPTEEQMLAAGWSIYVEPEPTNAEKLAAAKAEKIRQIENYDASDNVEQFTINGTPMWLGHELRQQIKTSVEAYYTAGETEVTKIFNGTEYTFTCAEWLQMLAALEIYAAEALNATERHKIAVNAKTSIKAVQDYDYTTGYPEHLEFGE